MKTRALLRAALSVALVAACSESSNEPDPPAHEVATITIQPGNTELEIGGTQTFTGIARDANGTAVSATLTWATSTPATATIDEDGVVTAVAVGTTEITATSGTVHSTASTVTVTAELVWPNTGPSSSSLIDAAVSAGTLTAEQGVLYKVYGAFVDPRLPEQYRGPVEEAIDNPILTTAAARMSTFSPATQTALAPFFLTLGDPNGWYAARFPLGAPPAAGAPRARAEDCTFLDALFTRRETAHFAVHYVNSDVYGAAIADIIVPELERVWITETEAFGRTPISDGNIVGKGNGCNGKLDIWLIPFAGQLAAGRRADPLYDAIGWTSTYESGCAPRASYINMWATPFLEPKKLRAFLAHEFFHVLEFGYTLSGGCSDAEWLWLSEATANWAMDLVYPTDNYEHGFAAGYLFTERITSIDDGGNALSGRTNGYSDYVFLLYLARTYGNSVIKDIWDATASLKSVEAVVSAVSTRGGIDNVWPEFGLALWNNYKDGDQQFLHDQDDLVWGLREMFDRDDAGMGPGQKSDSARLNGAPRKELDLLRLTLALPGLRRLSVQADYIKFTDASAASVLYLNALALATMPHYKIQALVKIGGTWRAPEDWTHMGAKAWCRDLTSERIQELVLIYTNSAGTRSGSDANPLTFLVRPNVGISNVGCNKWVGTASVDFVSAFGEDHASATDLVFVRERPAGAPLPDGSGQEAFTLVSGSVTGSFTAPPCASASGAGAAQPDDGRLLIHLDNQFFDLAGTPPPDRLITQGVGSSSVTTTTIDSCAPLTTTGPASWGWLEIPTLGDVAVSPSGRSMVGDTTITSPAGAQHLKWNLTAVRE